MFMDNMDLWEISELINGLEYCDRTSWEQCRILMAPYCKDISKSFPLPWDNETEDDEDPKITMDEVKAMAKAIEAKLQAERNKQD